MSSRLAYLLKHAWLRMAELNTAALARYGVDGRDLAVLAALAEGDQPSQQQAARSLGIDRTTMVGLLDGLERKGLVTRRPRPEDRRRNVVELTEAGRRILRDGVPAARDAERQFLAPLDEPAARQFRAALQQLLAGHAQPGGTQCAPGAPETPTTRTPPGTRPGSEPEPGSPGGS